MNGPRGTQVASGQCPHLAQAGSIPAPATNIKPRSRQEG